MKKTTHSKVMTIANRLTAGGIGRVAAMLKAWVLVKMPLVETKVAGVTQDNRQRAIEHLTRYDREQISIHLVRERDNRHDRNVPRIKSPPFQGKQKERPFSRAPFTSIYPV